MSDLDAEIAVEVNLTQPPKPIGYAIMKNGKVIAVLSRDQVKDAVLAFEEKERLYQSR